MFKAGETPVGSVIAKVAEETTRGNVPSPRDIFVWNVRQADKEMSTAMQTVSRGVELP